jgi:hypothetical protein
MLNALAAGGLALSMLTSPVAKTQLTASPPDGTVAVQVATVNGTGCPPGTAAVALDRGNSFFTVTYSSFTAQVGVGARPLDARKNCQIAIVVRVPQGFTYAIAKTDYRGYANLQPGAFGTERANYYFQGMSPTAYASHRFDGPWDGVWQATDQVGITALVYRRCGENRNFNINTELIVNAGTSNTHTTTSFMTMDSTDPDFETVYHLQWKIC